MKIIYLAGGCFWGAEHYLAGIRGVKRTEVGYANGKTEFPSYEQVKHEHTGHAETVLVEYDETELPLRVLLELFFHIIDPTSLNRQGHDEGEQYRTGIYYTSEEDAETVREALEDLQSRTEETVVVECEQLRQFFTAEEYHQKYLVKNVNGYCHVPLEEMRWVRELDPVAWYEEGEEERELQRENCRLKMMIVMRKDLGMRKGKIAAQAGHACVEALLRTMMRDGAMDSLKLDENGWWRGSGRKSRVIRWLESGEAKICVYVNSLEELDSIADRFREKGILCAVIHDAGHTEFHGQVTETCLATEPVTSSMTKDVTDGLPLY